MNRPTKEVQLPTSGSTVEIITFFTRGERKQIDSAKYAGATMRYQGGQSIIDNISPTFLNNQDDEMLKIGVIKLDGVEVKGNKTKFDELPDGDIEVVIKALSDVLNPPVDKNGETAEKKD